MITPDLLNYLRQELRKGKSPDTVKQEMVANGWQGADVDEGLASIQNEAPVVTTSGYQPSKAPMAIIGIILLVLLGAGGVLAYFFIYDTPERMMQTMATNLEKVKTYEFKGSAQIDVTSSNDAFSDKGTEEHLNPLQGIQEAFAATSVFNMQVQFDGRADEDDESNPKAETNFTVDYKGSDGSSMQAKVDTRTVDKVIYFNARKMPDTGGLMDFSMFENKWIKMDMAMSGLSSSPLLGGIGVATDSSQLKKVKEHKEKLEQAYLRHRFMIFDRAVTSETVNGVDTKHYKYKIDSELLKGFLIEAVPIVSEQKISNKEAEEQFKSFNILKNATGDIWVGKKDVLPYKFSFQTELRDDADKTSSGKLSFTMELNNFNKSFQITAPEGAKTFEELGQEVMESYYGSSGSGSILARSRDSQRLSDITTIRKAIDATMAMDANKKLPVCRKSSDQTKCSSAGAETNTAKRSAKNGWIPFDMSEFLATLPVDPMNGQKMVNAAGDEVTAYYFYRSDGSTYKIATYMEDPSNLVKAQSDGGTDPELFETGTGMTLPL